MSFLRTSITLKHKPACFLSTLLAWTFEELKMKLIL
jgi:hypothetical protein